MLLLSVALITSNAALILQIEWRKLSLLRHMIIPLQSFLRGTNSNSEYNWVILIHCPQGLCDQEGLFSCKRITAEPGDQPLFLFALVLSIPNIPARIFWGKYTIFSLYAFCPTKEIEWWEDASVFEVSCFLHTTMSVRMGLQIWSSFSFVLSCSFRFSLISKCFHD